MSVPVYIIAIRALYDSVDYASVMLSANEPLMSAARRVSGVVTDGRRVISSRIT